MSTLVRILNILLATVISFMLVSPAEAERYFFAAYRVINPGSGQAILVGSTAQDSDVTASAGTVPVYLSTNGNSNNLMSLISRGNNAAGVNVWGFKTRSATTDDANTIVQANDTLLGIQAAGADGASYRRAAAINFEVDGTPGASDMPGRIIFQTTADGASSPTERLRLSNNGSLGLERTNTAGGTTGEQTINKMAGSVNFAAAATSLVVTNSLVSATSNVFCVVQTNDATALLKNCTPAAGSFTINLNAAATAETRVAFWVTN